MKFNFSKLVWGTFFLLAAVFLLVNQFENFTDISIVSIIIAVIALASIVQSIASLRFSMLPVPLAILYYIFQKMLGLPDIPVWTLIVASVLASIGLGILLPNRLCNKNHKHKRYGKTSNNQTLSDNENVNDGNNPTVSVNFGSISRRLHSTNMETAQLYCNFGELEIFFDQVELSPNGAEAVLNCSFGAIRLFVPKHWQVIDHINCTLGGVDMEKMFSAPVDNAPKLKLSGSVSFGGIEVRYI